MPSKPTQIKLRWLLSSQFGFYSRMFLRSLRGLPVYFHNWARFRKGDTSTVKFMPCIHNRDEEGGTTMPEYFWQDLLVVRAVHAAKPGKQVDIFQKKHTMHFFWHAGFNVLKVCIITTAGAAISAKIITI